MDNKVLLISRCICINSNSIKQKIDHIADEITSVMNQKYNKVTLFSGQKFRSYSIKKYKQIEKYDINRITSIQYLHFPRGGKWTEDIQFELVFKKYSDNYFFITLVVDIGNSLENNYDYNLMTLGHKLLGLLSFDFNVNWMCLDLLDNRKKPEFFVEGVAYQNLNQIEKQIAHSIQLSELVHYKIPFLFAYTYFSFKNQIDNNLVRPYAKGYEVFFSENVNKEYTEYFDDEKWENTLRFLSDIDLIKF